MFRLRSPRVIALTFGILVICFAVGFYIFAWTGPTAAPPNDNISLVTSYAPSDIKTTTATHDGKFSTSNGYMAINEWIQANGCAGYHVCDASELTRYAQLHDMSGLSAGWYNMGTMVYPYIATVPNLFLADCNSWTTNEFVYPQTGGFNHIGAAWTGGKLTWYGCDDLVKVMCCK